MIEMMYIIGCEHFGHEKPVNYNSSILALSYRINVYPAVHSEQDILNFPTDHPLVSFLPYRATKQHDGPMYHLSLDRLLAHHGVLCAEGYSIVGSVNAANKFSP